MPDDSESGSPRLSRRELMERLLSGMAAGGVWPLLASTHPIHQHLKSDSMLDRAASLSQASDWTALFLNARQNAMLIPLAECMVPGSTTAHANRFIDLLLSVETAANQEKFNFSLATIERVTKERFGRRLASLTPKEGEALLAAVSVSAATRAHFDNLKEWISGAYYSSEQGMRELGWNGNYAFASYPECERTAPRKSD